MLGHLKGEKNIFSQNFLYLRLRRDFRVSWLLLWRVHIDIHFFRVTACVHFSWTEKGFWPTIDYKLRSFGFWIIAFWYNFSTETVSKLLRYSYVLLYGKLSVNQFARRLPLVFDFLRRTRVYSGWDGDFHVIHVLPPPVRWFVDLKRCYESIKRVFW